ncbi:relaxase/mobilization nuclease domain-containing protein [Vibrio parahaemolyticus]|uniref:relaxase/mobilization nuclease domain-containing protein n=1 Tax=Vibrio parahaemolyticus TaxID=670 RepID=UPI00215CD03F|nr:relaxase/mobilization nuclease domain-containing protein [Vibrio parahaemolyticus]MCR9836771.1 relaxase/mobilization nuclease domain-containing protein [Vibrio parahaemolyticus]
MAVISLFRTSGVGQSDPHAATNYLYGPLCSLTDDQKKEYSTAYQLRKLAREANDIQTEWECDYILQQQKGKRREPPPESINGNRKAVEYAIEHNPHKHKYVSGVIAHAFEDTEKLQANPEIEAEWRELFEELCFAGFPKDEQLIDWVRHTHQGNIENHFLIPRIHLATGFSFNPAPPGHEQDFNLLRDYLNLKHDLVSPLDSLHKRLTQDGNSFDKRHKLKKAINVWIKDMITSNRVNSRADIIQALSSDKFKEKVGVTHVSESSNFVRLHFKDKKNVRLYGFVFTEQFRSRDSLTQSSEPLQSKQSRLEELKDQLDKAIIKRANYNNRRYGLHKSKPEFNVSKAHYLPLNSRWTATPSFYISQPQVNFAQMPEFNPSLKGFEMVKQIEERKALAERNAKLALEQYHEQQKRFIQEWMSFLLAGKIEYERHRETISFTNYVIDEESADFKRAFARYDRDTERVLLEHDKRTPRTVSIRTQNNPKRHYSDHSTHDSRVPSLSRELERAISSVKRSIRIHETANQEIGTSLEHAGKLAERQRDSYLELGRAFEVIASEPKLRDELRSRLIRNETRKIPRMKKDGLRRVLKKLTKPQPHEQDELER